jgi:beta-lactamase regulating signal transducer with metallopeptidase domain/protocatechuate 3,4-dioxygenase beta subunit
MSAEWAFSVLAARATVILLIAAAASVLLRRASAATRHALFTSVVCVLLALPWLSLVLPTLDLPVLPAPAASIPAPASTFEPRAMDDEPTMASSMEPAALDEPATVDDTSAVDPIPPVPVFAPARRISLSMALLVLWAAGALAGVVQLAVSAFLVRRIAQRAAPIEDTQWSEALAAAAAQLGLRRPVRLVTSPSVVVPVVWGYRDGVVMLPPEADAWPADRKRAFLLHEIAHVARHDCLTQAFAHFARAVYWPHPLVWWAVRRLRAEAERACDDRVVTAGNPGAEYAHHLLEAARALKRAPRPLAVLAIAERSSLEDRLLALLDPGLRRGALTPRALAFGVMLTGMLAGTVAALQPVARAVLASEPETVPATAAAEPSPAASAPASSAVVAGSSGDASVRGTVKGPDGKPIAGALVLVAPAWNPRNTRDAVPPPEMVRTDGKGAFRISPRRPAPAYWLRVERADLLAETRSDVVPGTELSIALSQGDTTVEGTVVDATTKSPLAMATVTATEIGVSFTPPLGAPDAGQVEARTDAHGRYRFASLGPGAYRISPRAVGYSYLGSKVVQGNTRGVDFFLSPAGALEGTITGPDGRPVQGALVRADLETRWWISSPTVTTDARGYYEVAVTSGRYRVLVAAEGQAPTVSAPVSVQTGVRARADVRFSEAFRVRGRLLDPSHKPVRGTLQLRELDGNTRAGARVVQVLSAEAGPDGRFEIASAPSGAHVFEVTSPGLATRSLEVRLEGRGGTKDVGDVTLTGGAVVHGRVEDTQGAPVAGAAVFADQGGRKRESIRARADGTFSIGGLEPGAYDVRAEAYGFASAIEKAETGHRPVVLRLARSGGVTGLLVDEAGRPVFPGGLKTEPLANKDARAPILFKPGPEASQGRFVLEDLVAGPYEITIRADGFVPQKIRTDVEPGRVADAGRITLTRGRSASGIVVDGDGRPLAGVPVDDGSNQAATDASGRFEIHGLPAGTTSLTARHPNNFWFYSEPQEVTDPPQAGGVRLVLPEGGRLVGRLRWRKPGPRFPITVRASALRTRGGFGLETTIGDDGAFVMDDLPPGRVQVALLANEERYFHPTLASKEVVIEEGETTAVDLDIVDVRVHGRIARSGVPLADAQIALSRSGVLTRYLGPGIEQISLPERLRARADSEGRYEMIVPVAGRYRVTVWSGSDVSLPEALRTIEVTPKDEQTFDVEFAEVALRGRVLDDITGRPVAEASVGGSRTDSDGRFELRTAPGRQSLRVRAPSYAVTDTDVDVVDGGENQVTVRLRPGLTLTAHLADDKGQPVGSALVTAIAPDGRIIARGRSGDDGVARVEGLPASELTVAVSSPTKGLVVRRGVRPGPDPVTITIVPGTRVQLAVKDTQGRPMADQFLNLELTALDSMKVSLPFLGLLRTDARGVVEAIVPNGSIDLQVRRVQGDTGEVHIADAREGAVIAVTLAEGR